LQQDVLDTTRRLGTLRRCVKALRTGERAPLAVGKDTYAFLRDAGDGMPAIALFSRAASATTITLKSDAGLGGDWVDAISGEKVSLSGGPIAIAPSSFKILLPATSPCL
jgi:hypothetical protein